MEEEELTIPEETAPKEAEYEETEEVLISEEAFDTNSLELLLQVTDIWDKAITGQINEEEAATMIRSITSGFKKEKTTKRRRRKTTK